MTTLMTAFQAAENPPTSDNLPSTNEIQVLGGQILFQQQIDAFLNSLPTSVSAANEGNPALIGLLQLLLAAQESLSTILAAIETNNKYQQAIGLTVNNVSLVLTDAAILGGTGLVAAAYAVFSFDQFTTQVVTVSAAGAYTVPIPAGAKFADIVLSSAGGGAGGYNNPGAGTGGDGGDTTATPTGGATLTAKGGTGGASTTSATNSAGASLGDESFDGQTYTGGKGGAPGNNSPGGNGTAPGGGGGGGGAFGSFGGAGGTAGQWVAGTIPITSAMTEITGTVGAGGTAGAASAGANAQGGTGGDGSAFFVFYTPSS